MQSCNFLRAIEPSSSSNLDCPRSIFIRYSFDLLLTTQQVAIKRPKETTMCAHHKLSSPVSLIIFDFLKLKKSLPLRNQTGIVLRRDAILEKSCPYLRAIFLRPWVGQAKTDRTFKSTRYLRVFINFKNINQHFVVRSLFVRMRKLLLRAAATLFISINCANNSFNNAVRGYAIILFHFIFTGFTGLFVPPRSINHMLIC